MLFVRHVDYIVIEVAVPRVLNDVVLQLGSLGYVLNVGTPKSNEAEAYGLCRIDKPHLWR